VWSVLGGYPPGSLDESSAERKEDEIDLSSAEKKEKKLGGGKSETEAEVQLKEEKGPQSLKDWAMDAILCGSGWRKKKGRERRARNDEGQRRLPFLITKGKSKGTWGVSSNFHDLKGTEGKRGWRLKPRRESRGRRGKSEGPVSHRLEIVGANKRERKLGESSGQTDISKFSIKFVFRL